jgi:uncharacterized repeat protein (TIGR03803 family)
MPHQDFHFVPSRSVATFLYLAVFTFAASLCAVAQSETVLHSFDVALQGGTPQSLVADAFGNFYGTTLYDGPYSGGTAFRLSPKLTGGYAFTVIYNFGTAEGGYNPGPLTIDSAGNLYGTYTTATGNGVFKLFSASNDVWRAGTIASYSSGAGPIGLLNFDQSGNLYGVNQGSSSTEYGAIYELSPTQQETWTLSTLYAFTGNEQLQNPNSGLAFDKAGNIYGTTSSGGDPECNGWDQRNGTCGVVYQLSKGSDGSWTENTLVSFNYDNGMFPAGGLVFDSAGNLYGASPYGIGDSCSQGCGGIYRVSPNSDGTWTQTILYTFAGSPDAGVPTGVVLDSHGNIFGTSTYGGRSGCGDFGCGAIFEISPLKEGWAEQVIYRFGSSFPGSNPVGGVTLDSAGNLFGTTDDNGPRGNCGYYGQSATCLGAVYELSPGSHAQWSATTLYMFTPGSDGLWPTTSLVADSAGNLYGITLNGGNYYSSNCTYYGCGTLYEMSPQPDGGWTESILYPFSQSLAYTGSGAAAATAGLIMDSAGNFYGTSYLFGDPACSCGYVFEISPTGTGGWQQKTLYNFLNGSDGEQPDAALTLGPNGQLYGTASTGTGANYYGNVFQLTPNSDGTWTHSVIYTFHGPDGSGPDSALVLDPAGNLYGTTGGGGFSTLCYGSGCGTIFELTPTSNGSWTESVLYSFGGGVNGSHPSGVVRDSAGNLYGTTASGGKGSAYCNSVNRYYDGCGVVFEVSNINGHWSKSVVYAFEPPVVPDDGAVPQGGVVLDSEGNLYGTTSYGGILTCLLDPGYYPGGCGTVYKLTPQSGGWVKTNLYAFQETADGYEPVAAPYVDAFGNVFGTTLYGGAADWGAVYEIPAANSAVSGAATPHVLRRRNSIRHARPTVRIHGAAAQTKSIPDSSAKEIR